MPRLGYWHAHSDRDFEGRGRDPDDQEEAEEAARELREEIDGLKATIQRLSADVEAAVKWMRAYEEAHGPLKSEPHVPDFMIMF